MRSFGSLLLIVFIIVGSYSCTPKPDETEIITTETLFLEMIDMVGLTYFPEPPYKTVQYSSFDRRSTLPGGPNWYANSDGFGGEPNPNFEEVIQEPGEDGIGEYLIADVHGPGAIVRLWTARINGQIKLFLDDHADPVYDGLAQDFFQKTYDLFAEVENLDRERMEKTVYQRDASYTPIPFAARMRLVWIGNLKEIHFYQVGVRLYPENTALQSFSPQDLVTYKDPINKVINALADPDENLDQISSESPVIFAMTLQPGEEKEIFSLEGMQAIERLTVKLSAGDMDKALRQTLINIICDDYPWGQVQSPVGDLFGAAPGINPYQSLPFTVQPDGTMICRFVMPFEKNIKVKMVNQGEQAVGIEGTALAMAYAWDAERSMRFRARWRADHNIIASNRAVQDLPFIVAHGKGVYVGTTSYLLNPNDVPTPYGSWWGEGDEKIFVDDDVVPSVFGTGSEDYYNYSWSSPDIFYYPYCGQPRNDGPGNRGFVTNFRWHILDPLPFQKNIRFYMELFSHERTPGLSYARMGYHYARPGVSDDHLAIMPEDLRHLELPEIWKPANRMGARNSVFYEAEQIISERIHTRMLRGRLWSGARIQTWYPRNSAESKAFSFRIDEKGTYRVHFAVALTPNAGRISVSLNDQFTSLTNNEKIIDLNRPYRTLLRNFTLPATELEPGRHTLVLKFEGAPAAVERPEIGVDFIWIQKTNR
ncbi:MAG: DUF2961 domain-containing protein [Candidatus Aminicenantes bacterium]|nr:MAG: DUF2961 domain-containing protein [Candidatus Aminicenantes bacterium]